MRMDEFMNALQSKLDTLQPNYPDHAESILEVLFDAYNESSGFDNAAIKADFEKLYCRDHEKAGFIEGVKVGMSLDKELNIP